jgi:hypothetical protein
MAWCAESPEDTDSSVDGQSDVILGKYLEASKNRQAASSHESVEMDINASIPKLKEHGRLKALRKISSVGRITYHVLGFQGDNTVKNQVIARYLQAEQQGQSDSEKMDISPANYKFKLKGRRETEAGRKVYIFALSPRHKRLGLFKGEMWLDAASYLPVFEKGKWVKNPSFIFKSVEFERAYSMRNGIPVPATTTIVSDTRVVGKVQIEINYSNYGAPTVDDDGDGAEAGPAAGTVQNRALASLVP